MKKTEGQEIKTQTINFTSPIAGSKTQKTIQFWVFQKKNLKDPSKFFHKTCSKQTVLNLTNCQSYHYRMFNLISVGQSSIWTTWTSNRPGNFLNNWKKRFKNTKISLKWRNMVKWAIMTNNHRNLAEWFTRVINILIQVYRKI